MKATPYFKLRFKRNATVKVAQNIGKHQNLSEFWHIAASVSCGQRNYLNVITDRKRLT